jgi:hypothetical protein
MSIKYLTYAFDARVNNPLRKLVLLKLCDNANDDGECWPSFGTVAAQCEMSRSSAIRHVQALIDDGFMSAHSRFKDGEQTSNMYKISKAKLLGSGVTVTPPSVTVTPPLVSECYPPSVTVTPRTVIEPSIRTVSESNTTAQAPDDLFETDKSAGPEKTSKPKTDYPDWFKSIMAVYPKRAGGNNTKQAYAKAQARIKEGATHDQLLWSAERYSRFIAVTGKTGTEFVKQASTFFGSMENIENKWAPPALGANNAGQPKSPIERFMRKHYPNAGPGPENDHGPMGRDDGPVRGAMDPQLRGDTGRIGPMDQDIIGDFSRTDS